MRNMLLRHKLEDGVHLSPSQTENERGGISSQYDKK